MKKIFISLLLTAVAAAAMAQSITGPSVKTNYDSLWQYQRFNVLKTFYLPPFTADVPSQSGALRYNSGNQRLQIFKSGVWVSIGDSTAGIIPTWQQTLTAGSTLTQDAYINAHYNNIRFDSVGSNFQINWSNGYDYGSFFELTNTFGNAYARLHFNAAEYTLDGNSLTIQNTSGANVVLGGGNGTFSLLANSDSTLYARFNGSGGFTNAKVYWGSIVGGPGLTQVLTVSNSTNLGAALNNVTVTGGYLPRYIFGMGSSLTRGYGPFSWSDTTTWLYKTGNLTGYTPLNYGRNGRSGQDTTAGDSSLFAQINVVPYPLTIRDIIVIDPFVNDVLRDTLLYYLAKYTPQITAYVDTVLAHGFQPANVWLRQPSYFNPPYSGGNQSTNLPNREAQYSAATQSIATATGVNFYDAYNDFKTIYLSNNSILGGDSVHLPPSGQTVAANLFYTKLIAAGVFVYNRAKVSDSIYDSQVIFGNSSISGNLTSTAATINNLLVQNQSFLQGQVILGANYNNNIDTPNTRHWGWLSSRPYNANAYNFTNVTTINADNNYGYNAINYGGIASGTVYSPQYSAQAHNFYVNPSSTSTASPNLAMKIFSNNAVAMGFGTTYNDSSKTLNVQGGFKTSGNISAPSWGGVGINFNTAGATYNDNTASGTLTFNFPNSFGNVTLTSTNTVTDTYGGVLYLGTAAGSGNTTITNPVSLFTAGNIIDQANLTVANNAAGGITVGNSAIAGPFYYDVKNTGSATNNGYELAGTMRLYANTTLGGNFTNIADAGNASGGINFWTNTTQKGQIFGTGNWAFQHSGTFTDNTSVLAQFNSTSQGVRLPIMTTTQQNAIISPATGLIIWNSDSLTLVRYTGAAWLKFGTGNNYWARTGTKLTTATASDTVNAAYLQAGTAPNNATSIAYFDNTTLPISSTSISTGAITNNGLIGGLGYAQVTGTLTESTQSATTGIAGRINYSSASAQAMYYLSHHSGVWGNILVIGNGSLSGAPEAAIEASAELSGTGNIDSLTGLLATYPIQYSPGTAYSGTVANYFGAFIRDASKSGIVARLTNHYGIYQAGATDPNVFNGLVSHFNGMRYNYVAKTAAYTLLTSDYTVNFTTGTVTATLPTAVGCTGQEYVIKNTGTGTITIATTSSQTIDGAATKTISTQYSGYRLQSNGANWMVTATF